MKKLLSLLLITALLCGCAEKGTQATTTTAGTTTTTPATTTTAQVTTTTTASTTTTTTTTTTEATTTPETTTTPEVSEEPEEVDIYANPTDTAMPEREHECENNDYYLPCIDRFDSVSGLIMKIVDRDELHEWVEKMDANKTPYDIEDYINIYSFMVYFDLSFEEIYPAIEEHNTFQKEWADKGYQGAKDVIYTDEDLEVLKSGDKATITKHFAREYSIVVGDKIYNPNWIYNHTIEDYEAQGITKEMISEKIEVYRTLTFSAECRAALEAKFETFIGEDVDLSYVSPNA